MGNSLAKRLPCIYHSLNISMWFHSTLKSKQHNDDQSLITCFLLCYSIPYEVLSVANTKRSQPKLLLNLLNSRVKAIPTLCYRLHLLLIQMTMTAIITLKTHQRNPRVHTSSLLVFTIPGKVGNCLGPPEEGAPNNYLLIMIFRYKNI